MGLDENPSIEELRECFEAYFPDTSSELMTVIGRMDQLVAKLMKDLDVEFDLNVHNPL